MSDIPSVSIDVWPEDDDSRWRAAVRVFTTHHEADPKIVTRDGVRVTASVDYHARLSAWVRRLDEAAPLPARLGALAQHVRRFEFPRTEFAATPTGYKQWRVHAGLRQAELVRIELEKVGYLAPLLEAVVDALLKKRLRHDAGAALLEDAVCLRFIEDELAAFSEGRGAEQVQRIVTKTWAKMSARAHEQAVHLLPQLPAELAALVRAARGG